MVGHHDEGVSSAAKRSWGQHTMGCETCDVFLRYRSCNGVLVARWLAPRCHRHRWLEELPENLASTRRTRIGCRNSAASYVIASP